MNTELSGEPYIACPSCKSKNSSEATHCSICKADLLPGKPLIVRLLFGGLIVVGIGIPILLGMEIPRFFTNIFFLFGEDCFRVIIMSMIVVGFLGAFFPSALSERYIYRADRHVSISPSQSILDYTHALNATTADLAKCGILIKRAEALMKLGRVSDALSDFQACIDTPQPTPKPKHAYSLDSSSYTLWKKHRDKAFLRIKEIKQNNQL